MRHQEQVAGVMRYPVFLAVTFFYGRPAPGTLTWTAST